RLEFGHRVLQGAVLVAFWELARQAGYPGRPAAGPAPRARGHRAAPPVRLAHLPPRVVVVGLAGAALAHGLDDVRRPGLAAPAGRDLLAPLGAGCNGQGSYKCPVEDRREHLALELARPLGVLADVQRLAPGGDRMGGDAPEVCYRSCGLP